MVASVFFYSIYVLLSLAGCAFAAAGNTPYVLSTLILLAPLDVTAFVNAGLPITGFYLVLIAALARELLVRMMSFNWRFRINQIQIAHLAFLFFAAASLIFSVYYSMQYEVSSSYDMSAPQRLLRSLFKFSLVIAGLLIISQSRKKLSLRSFALMVALSGLVPTIACFVEYYAPGGLSLYHNNKTYAEVAHWINHMNHVRPVGFSNEASFFAYMDSFAFAGSIYFVIIGKLREKMFFGIYGILQFIAVTISLSRTGMLMFGLVAIAMSYHVARRSLRGTIGLILVICLTLAIAYIVSLKAEYDLASRFLSTFKLKQAVAHDTSTIERYGVAEALWEMVRNQNPFWGLGYHNYYFHIKKYLPSFLTMGWYRQPGYVVPSFNLFLQLAVEFGTFWFFLFIAIVIACCRSFFKMHNNIPSMDRALFVSMLVLLAGGALSCNVLAFAPSFFLLIHSACIDRREHRAVRVVTLRLRM